MEKIIDKLSSTGNNSANSATVNENIGRVDGKSIEQIQKIIE